MLRHNASVQAVENSNRFPPAFLSSEATKYRPFAAIALVTLFFLVVIVTLLTDNSAYAPAFLKSVVKYHFELMLFLALVGMSVGAVIYYLMTGGLGKKENTNKKNAELLLKFLNHDERKVLTTLLNNGGKAMQYEISRLEGFTRLRAHRIIFRLENEGIIRIEKMGKVNSIQLVEEVKNLLQGYMI